MKTGIIARIVTLLISIVYIMSCRPVKTISTATPTLSTTGRTSTATVTPNISSNALTPTRTASLPTANILVQKTSLPTPISSQVGTKWPVSTCSDDGRGNEPPPDYGISGSLLYHDLEKKEFGLLGGTPITKTVLPLSSLVDPTQEGLSIFGFSPDGRWLAYGIYPYGNKDDPHRNSQNWRFGLFSYLGEQIVINLNMEDVLKIIPEYAYLAYMSGEWVNNDLLFVWVGYASGGYMAYSEGFILDPFKGIWREDLLTDIPEIDREIPFALSPDITRILYNRQPKAPVLRDMKRRLTLWTGEPALFKGILIRWTPDSTMFAIETGEQHLIVNRGGNVIASIAKLTSQNDGSYNFQWSPDSRFLAIDAHVGSETILHIYDSATKQITFTCPHEGSISYWSPDGYSIAFVVIRASEPYVGVLNLQNGTITKLMEDISVLGWSDKFPTDWLPQK